MKTRINNIRNTMHKLVPQGVTFSPSPLERAGVRLLLLCILFLSSCEDNDTTPVMTGISASTLNSIPIQSTVLIEPGKGEAPLLCTFTWSATQFFLDGSDVYTSAGKVDYTLEIAKAGDEFAGAQILASTANLRADIMVADINDLLINKLMAEPGEVFDAEFRIAATYGEGLPKVEYSTNSLKMSITPYKPTTGIPSVYLVGDMNGWSNTNTDFRMFRSDSDDENKVYTYTGRLAGYFKACPEESLGSYKMYCSNPGGVLTYEDRGDGSFFAEDGYYTFTIDVDAMTWTLESYDMTGIDPWPDLYLVGAYSGWGSIDAGKMTALAYDPHIWTLSITLDTVEYGVKFRVGDNWDNRWCPAVPNAVPYGVADFNPTGHDNNIDLGTNAGDYNVIFNDLTGQYIIELQE
ncbi:SusE domain-containing protein [Bacteroides sp. 51]|uniref:SusE domain-containing protein n=1 Tax=Bacteroides sp. 51 TaxID=2302938 RepID=UPI0013D50A50|nr:SusE domain-containing protein [Bacteroides sp. 51]NDV81644.1 SusF/SusE family outer membrane protein [Bacteroides sp. 51]